VGIPAIAAGLLLGALGNQWSLDQNDRLSLMVSALLLVWIAAFILCFGIPSLQAALFPLLFLLLMIPIPTVLLDKIVFVLQKGSAVAAYCLFKLLGMPVLWRGFQFSLPGVDIEIAKECSGIRSSMALFITGTLAGHYFLQTGWKKAALVLLTVPIAILKNAARIVTISSLGVYVDQGYLTGRLHHKGGFVFSILALAILVPSLILLQRSENNARGKTPTNVSSGDAGMETEGYIVSGAHKG